jgi:hypothetical protein
MEARKKKQLFLCRGNKEKETSHIHRYLQLQCRKESTTEENCVADRGIEEKDEGTQKCPRIHHYRR